MDRPGRRVVFMVVTTSALVLLFWWWPERWAIVMLVYFLAFYLLLFLPWSMKNKTCGSVNDSLVPIGDAVSGLDHVLVPAIRDASPQARHSFTVADQVNQLVSAREADPDRGFLARTMALCSLPRSNPGDQHQYTRANGPNRQRGKASGQWQFAHRENWRTNQVQREA